MAKKTLTDFDEAFAVLGGYAGVCALTKRSQQSVCNWKARGNFPAVLVDVIRHSLRSRGYSIAPELFRLEKRDAA